MMKYIIGLSLIFLINAKVSAQEKDKPLDVKELAQAVEKTSSKAEAQITKADELLEQGLILQAEKLFKEAAVSAKNEKNTFLEAQALTGLADIYSTERPNNMDGSDPKKIVNMKLSAQKYQEAAEKLLKANYSKHAAMAYYGAAEIYKKTNEKKACDLYVKSAKAYDIKSEKNDDQLNPEVDEQIGPVLKLYKKQNYKIDCYFTSEKTSEKAVKSTPEKKKK